MVNLWFTVLTVTLLNGGRALEHLEEQDKPESRECRLTCGSNPLPIPMVQRERTLPEERDDSVRSQKSLESTLQDKPESRECRLTCGPDPIPVVQKEGTLPEESDSVRSQKSLESTLQDKPESRECRLTCGSNPLPIPMVQKERTLPEERDSVRSQKRLGSKLRESAEMKTNFSCHDKPYIPGFYADVEAECRIFHLCLQSEVDHFMCPPGTAFNQDELVCEPDSNVNCNLSSQFYDANQRVHTGPATMPEAKHSLPNEETNRWLFDLLKGSDPHNATSEDILERNLIRMLILMQFTDITAILADLLYLRDSSGTSTESSMDPSDIKGEILKQLIREVFPLLPVKFGTDRTPPSQNVQSTTYTGTLKLRSDLTQKLQSTQWRSFWEIDPLEEVPQEEESSERPPLQIPDEENTDEFPGVKRPRTARILGFLGSRNQKAVEIAEVILDIIGTIAGVISEIAREKVVTNYVNYINSNLVKILQKLEAKE